MKALVIYWTKSTHTASATEDVAEGLRETGAQVDVVDLRQAEGPDVTDCDLMVVGSPCHAGSVPMGSGIAPKVADFLAGLADGVLAGKRAGAFVAYSSAGGQRTLASIEGILREKGAEVPTEGVAVKAGVPLSLWVGPKASATDRENLRALGRALAEGAGSQD